MIWSYFAAQQISTGNPLLDSAYYVFGVGAFLLGAFAVAIVYLVREGNKRESRMTSLEDKYDKLQEQRLQDLKETAAQQIAPLAELKNFIGVLYEQFRDNNGAKR